MTYRTIIAILAVAAMSIPPQAPARGDEASPSLAQFDQQIDKSIDDALAYLARQQKPDGCFGEGNSTAVTSLCVMAFLAKGHTPGAGQYGQVIYKGVDFVLGAQKPNGMLIRHMTGSGPIYYHCISTLMLSEVSGMVDAQRQKSIDNVLPRALKIIVAAQQIKKPANQQGGWRYQLDSTDSDISCTGWALMSLRSARNGGASIPRESIDEALKFIMACQWRDGGFCYQPGGGPSQARTGTAILCLELCGRHREAPCIAAGDWVLKHLSANVGETYFYYGLYYCSQGMFQLGGDYWERFARHMYAIMLKSQQKDGSWPAGGSGEAVAGPCYSTAMSVLAMSVSYRQLPIYQR